MSTMDGCTLCALPVSEWFLVYSGTNPACEGTREALSTLGNCYMATRSAAPEG